MKKNISTAQLQKDLLHDSFKEAYLDNESAVGNYARMTNIFSGVKPAVREKDTCAICHGTSGCGPQIINIVGSAIFNSYFFTVVTAVVIVGNYVYAYIPRL
jgi:hypothetical protein